MRLDAIVLVLAGAWLLLPACGVVADDASCGANTCGACPSGLVNRDVCQSGNWDCTCVAPPTSTPPTGTPPAGQCKMAPVCGPNEKQMPDRAACDRLSGAKCHSQSACGTTIWCAYFDTSECDGYPECDEGDKPALPGSSDCPPGGTNCYEREACGVKISCARHQVWPSTASTLVAVNEGGGFVPTPPPGSPCAMGQAKYTFTRASRTLAWEVCDSNVTPYKLEKSQRTLTFTEADSIESAMSTVKLVLNPNTCGADKPLLWISVTSPSGTNTFLDDFYSCQKQGTYVENIDAVFGALRPLPK